MRFLHIADVHLDTAFACRSSEIRDRLRKALREAFERCVDTAVSEKVDAVLIAGDLFDGTSVSFETERFLLEQFRELADAGIQVIYVTGNHDPGQELPAAIQDWPDAVTIIRTGDPVIVEVGERPGEAVGYVSGVGHTTSHETDDLSLCLRPRADTSLPQIALLHTQVTSASESHIHQPYAPSSVDNLRSAGFHYWALGHVHTQQRLSESPSIHYSGNLQGRHPRETGAKGGLLVDLSDPAWPGVESKEFSRVRWKTVTVETLSNVQTFERLVDEIADAWDKARSSDPGRVDTEWMLTVDLTGPSPMYGRLRNADELETIGDELVTRTGILAAEVRNQGVHPMVRLEEHKSRRDTLGETLRLTEAIQDETEKLPVSEDDLAGFDPKRDGSPGAYIRRLMAGAGEEITLRMLRDLDGSRE